MQKKTVTRTVTKTETKTTVTVIETSKKEPTKILSWFSKYGSKISIELIICFFKRKFFQTLP